MSRLDANRLFCGFAECFKVGVWAIATGVVDVAAFILGVYFLAKRRSMLREKFGIAGSQFKDFCLYCWCLQCAICQVCGTTYAPPCPPPCPQKNTQKQKGGKQVLVALAETPY